MTPDQMPAPERTPPDVVTVNTDDLRTVLNQRNLHAHQDHGIWDDDNGEKSGTACRECSARDTLIAALDLARPMTTPPACLAAPVTAESLRGRYARAAAEWALMYPISSWALREGEAAEKLAEIWGEQIARYLTEYVRDEELERLRAELAEVKAERDTNFSVLQRVSKGGWETATELVTERIARQQAERELTEAKQAVYTAQITHIRERHPNWAHIASCSGCQVLVPLSLAMPARPDDPEEIRRLARATTEETNDG